jgi:predicted esterase
MMRTYSIALLVWPATLVVAGGPVTPACGADEKPTFGKQVYSDGKNKLPYRLLTPANFVATRTYPLVVFLHGSGERGTDNEKQLGTGLPAFTIKANREKYPCFIVAPQCSTKEPLDYWGPTVSSGLVMGMIKNIERRYSVDPKRIYITGLSDGGWGVWQLLLMYPEKFAAAVPICGGGNPAVAGRVVRLPVWVFHSKNDTVEPVKSSQEMVAALKRAGGTPKYTEFPNEGHGCWDRAYRDPKLMAWLFDQKRASVPAPPTAQQLAARRLWRHGRGSFKKAPGDKWIETLDKNTKVFVETNHTKDYVELYHPDEDASLRFYANRCELRFGSGSFKKIYDGGWREK